MRPTEPSVSGYGTGYEPGYEIEHERQAVKLFSAGESADALRRRADALLDEMMLNGVDIAAGEHSGNGIAALHSPTDASADSGYADSGYANGFTENGLHQQKPATDFALHSSSPTVTMEKTMTMGARLAEQSAAAPDPTGSSATVASTRSSKPDALFTPLLDVPLHPDARLVPAEERYPRPAASAASPVANGYAQPGSAVRRQSASLASTMTVGGRANMRSALLPRALEVDVDTVAQEIMALSSEISAALPVGHEAAERSRHLLNKAQNILQNDPSRTAEVDYYLQQVRRIVQRTRQTHTYSAIYHRRLLIYLTAWVALALVALTARYLLEDELFVLLEELFWTGRDAVTVQFGPMVLVAFFAGALGGALGVLLNVRRHAAQEYGYFDRKYGLRGLTLPLLGALFGALLALVWAAVCHFLALDPTNVWISGLPIPVAFFIGFSQEWLYGAR